MISGLEANHRGVLVLVRVQHTGRNCFRYFIRLLSIKFRMYDCSLHYKMRICQGKSFKFNTRIVIYLSKTVYNTCRAASP